MSNQNTQPKNNLKEALFHKIECENLCPRSRMFFKSQEFLVWSLWVFSVLVGAFAVAVSLFVVAHQQYEMYEATHENFLTFAVEALPYLWLLVFGVMVYSAVYNLRHTKGGYRYPVSYIITSSIVLSFAGGAALQLFGFGYTIDHILGKNMPIYTSQEKFEENMWQVPEEGRLLGKQVFSTLAPTSTVIFEDIDGERWVMNVAELSEMDMNLLAKQQTVRLLGLAINPDLKQFHACGAFPWMSEKGVTREDMAEARNMFEKRVYDIMVMEKKNLFEQEGQTKPNEEKKCPKLAAVRRMNPAY